MSSSVQTIDPSQRIAKVLFSSEEMTVVIQDGRKISVPIEKYPFLKKASREQREKLEIFGEESSIYWTELEEFLDLEAILMGYPALKEKRR